MSKSNISLPFLHPVAGGLVAQSAVVFSVYDFTYPGPGGCGNRLVGLEAVHHQALGYVGAAKALAGEHVVDGLVGVADPTEDELVVIRVHCEGYGCVGGFHQSVNTGSHLGVVVRGVELEGLPVGFLPGV